MTDVKEVNRSRSALCNVGYLRPKVHIDVDSVDLNCDYNPACSLIYDTHTVPGLKERLKKEIVLIVLFDWKIFTSLILSKTHKSIQL